LLKNEKYKDVRTKLTGENFGPHYYLNTGPAESFKQDVKEAQKNLADNEKVSIEYQSGGGGYWDFIWTWGGPLLLIFILWMFLMRRVGGGGAGPQLFNIGKSKATRFNQDLHGKITFIDVAGLELMQEDVME